MRKRLIAMSRKAKRPSKEQLFSGAMKRRRVKWAKKYKDWTENEWKKVLFSDESHFLVQGQYRCYERRSEGEKVTERHINQKVKHPRKQMFLVSFSFNGLGSLYPCSGIINANRYINVVNHKVMRDMQIAFPDDGGDIFQHDLAPCHSAKKVQKVLQENEIKVLEWPGNSLDLKPINNLWDIIKNKLSQKTAQLS